MPRSVGEFRYAGLIRRVMPPEVESDVIWHYTTTEGALGIIRDRVLWATSVVMLNDTAEIKHGMGLIEDFLERIDASSPGRDLIAGWVRDTRAKLDAFQLADSYVFSASLDGDSQTQFKLYGSYALGFNSGMRLTKRVLPEPPRGVVPMAAGFDMGWRRVLYRDDEKQRHVARLFRVLEELAAIQLGSTEHLTDVYEAAIECILRAAAYLKDKQFAHEREVRLYGRGEVTSAEVFLRPGPFGIVPYLKIQSEYVPDDGIDRLPLMKINLGPGLVDPTSATIGLNAALRLNGYALSPIPIENVAGSSR